MRRLINALRDWWHKRRRRGKHRGQGYGRAWPPHPADLLGKLLQTRS